jgi:phosphatidylglycerol:prolipoprotein diacylglycerol transferase
VLILVNLSDIRRHPSWLLAIAMVHHPLLAAAGIAAGAAAVLVYARWAKLPLAAVVDALAAPVSVGMAAEQLGALLAGSGYGSETNGTWAVTYSSPLAARWSGTPIGVPLYPVQAYAAIGAILIAATLCIAMRRKRRPGDIAGIWLIATGALLAFTEMFRDWEGRGVLFHGYADLPQLVGLGLVILGGATLLDWHAHTPVAEKVGDV